MTSDARKRLAENGAAEVHHIHPDAGVRALIERERRAAAAEAWDEGALWAAVECGAIDHECVPFLVPEDNPYLDSTGGDA